MMSVFLSASFCKVYFMYRKHNPSALTKEEKRASTSSLKILFFSFAAWSSYEWRPLADLLKEMVRFVSSSSEKCSAVSGLFPPQRWRKCESVQLLEAAGMRGCCLAPHNSPLVLHPSTPTASVTIPRWKWPLCECNSTLLWCYIYPVGYVDLLKQ